MLEPDVHTQGQNLEFHVGSHFLMLTANESMFTLHKCIYLGMNHHFPIKSQLLFYFQAFTAQVLTVTIQETSDVFSLPDIMRAQGHLYTGNFCLYI